MKSLRNTLLTVAAVAALMLSASAQQGGHTESTKPYTQAPIPSGTVLPVRLNSSVSSVRSKPEQTVKARIMQDVPLGPGSKIRAGTEVIGRVVEVIPASRGTGAKVVLRFDTLRLAKRAIPIKTNVRALASPMEVEDAQIPKSGPDEATPPTSWTTVQVGSEVVYRGGGHVMDGENVVGEPVPDGVLSRVRANPEENCPGSIGGNDRAQALWVFSSNACGAFGFSGLTIAHVGRKDPVGEIVLTSNNERILNIRSGSGMLLRVTTAPGGKSY